MSQAVQAKCPHCQQMLRIPAAWLNLPMKCKHCQQIFQTRPRSRESAFATKTPLPQNAEPLIHSASLRYRKKGGFWKTATVFALLLAVLGGMGYFIYPYVRAIFAADQKEKTDQQNVAVLTKPKGDPISEKKPDLVPEKKDLRLEPVVQKDDPKKDIKPDDPPKKPQSPVKNDPPKKKDQDQPKKKKAGPDDNGPYPRRALLINVSNYLLFNPLHYGNDRSGKYPGSNTAVLADLMSRPPLNMPAAQITELSDTGKKAFATNKEIIEKTIENFVASARAQDRVIILFTGHAIEIEKAAYLVPVEGNRDDAKTLIPLTWVYDELAKCKARQKLLILDVFRFPPARGEELPGAGEMTEDFEAKLLKPPPGVQVWSSCVKGQQSIELEGGSVFMQALSNALQEGPHPITSPRDPLPLDRLLTKVNDRLKTILAPQKLEQVSRLTGTHVEEGGAAYNAAEPLPPKLVLKAIVPSGGAGADPALVADIVAELNRLPAVRGAQRPVQAAGLPLFSAKALEDYKPDYKTWAELVDLAKDKEKYPLRAEVLQAIQVLKTSEKIRMEEKIGSPITPAIKKQYLAKQQQPGLLIFEMENALAQMKVAGAKRDLETSKRWQAHFDYAMARLQARLVFIYEYDNILAQVRGDNLPELQSFQTGWRVGSIKKVQISESKVRDMVKNIQKAWKRIADEHPGTPWAILATRENMMALGLVWRPSRD
jgi:Caspase domain